MPAKNTKTQSTDIGFSLISDEKLLALYAALLKCRMISRRTRSEASLAVSVGVAIDLLPGDSLAASGAGAITRFVKSRFAEGDSLRRILNAHTTRRVSGAAALKAALRKARVNKGAKGQGKKSANIAVALCEDSSAPARIWRESLREAASKRLPILFVCCAADETGGVQSLVPKSRFPVVVVDSNDVVAMYRVASEAIAHARRGNGPTLIVCQPWLQSARHAAHDHDPILNMEKYLVGKRLFSSEFKRKTTSPFARELRAAASVEND
jgi:hypothetical protein